MIFSKKIKDITLKKNKYVDSELGNVGELDKESSLPSEFYVPKDIIGDTAEAVIAASQLAHDYFKKKEVEIKPFFDDELLNKVKIFESFVRQTIPDHKGYIEVGGDGYSKISYQVYLDARDILYKEMHIDPFSILNSGNVSGVYNDKWVFFSNGFSMDENGIIRDRVNHTIFNPKDPNIPIKFLDLINKTATVEGGIRIKLPNDWINKNITNNDLIDGVLPDFKPGTMIPTDVNKDKLGSHIDGVINGTPLTEDDSWLTKVEPEDLFTGDIWGEDMEDLDFPKEFKDTLIRENLNEMCNFASIPYAELNELLLEGGGQKGVMPLANDEITADDIKFGSDGTAYYSGINSTITVKYNGCKTKKYKTGHVMMWSSSNPVGPKRSRLQRWWKFCHNIGLFNANIPKLVGFKKFKVFPGLCIGGLIAHWFASQQEEISKRINELFKCEPAEPPINPELTGFDRNTYLEGEYPAVNVIEDLDKIMTVMTGDKFIVKIYEAKHSGLNNDTCAVFTYDPNGEFKSENLWYYGSWSGKPYIVKNEVTVYKNDTDGTLMHGYGLDNLGEDSISAKLLSLQYAFMRHEALLEKSDIESSIERCFENVLTDVIDNSDLNLGQYQYFEEFTELDTRENRHYLNMFYEYFRPLESKYKFADLEKIKKIKYSDSEDGTGYSVEYWDWDSLDDTYIKPYIKNIPGYDIEKFALEFAIESESLEVIKSNLEYMEEMNIGTSKYADVKRLWDYVQLMDASDMFIESINTNIEFKKKELEWADFTEYATSQLNRRVWTAIKNTQIL